jgi:hypothetical protein
MDLSGSTSQGHPSPATLSSQSRGGSTSHSSYSPNTTATEHHLPYRASPKPNFNQPATTFQNFNTNTASLPNTSSPTLHGGVEMFSNVYSNTGMPPDETFNQGFLMGNEWEYAAMNVGSTGMTPMSDGNWTSMLESVTMGWDGLPAGPEGELK